MLDPVIFEKYSVDTQAKTNDWFTEYGGKDTHGQLVTVLALYPALVPVDDLLPRLEATTKKLASIPPDFHPSWLQTGRSAGVAVIVCAATDGETLASRIASSGGLPPEDVIDLAYRLGKYLESLHTNHLLQGVFSPQEVVFTGDEGAPVVTNPALADFLDLPQLLASSALPERPHYAPELLAGQPVDALSDIYSLGALLFEALTGKPVSRPELSPGKTMIVTWLPSRLRRDIPPALDELVATCLHPEPGKRYPSLGQFMAAVEDQRPKTAPTPSMMGMEDSLVGQTLGAYRLMERLGQGGMATVYKAYEPALNRYVAIKVLPQFFANDPSFATRFRREAKAVAQLNHPNIVPIYSYGESNGITYIAMQYVEGGTLKHERGEKTDSQSALRLLLPITRALSYAHEHGIIHRDVKPSNVLLGDGGWPVLADFGLARMAEGSSEKLTGTGVGMGTPMYMSPEQGQGVNVDHRSDIYALGIMLYEFVTGDVPFRADTPMAIVIKHMTAPMPMPRTIDPTIPEVVENIILKATAKDPSDRYQSAKDMADAMEAVLLGTAVVSGGRKDAPAAPVPAATHIPVSEDRNPAPPAGGKRPAPARPSGGKKLLRWLLFAILGILGFCLLAVILMGIFDICPPQGPWPQPPWCPGSPFQFSFANAPTPIPTRTRGPESNTATPTLGPAEINTFGNVLLQDDFYGSLIPAWQFNCSPYSTRWILEEVDGRTVLHSQPASPPGEFSCAAIQETDWRDYAIEFAFKFAQPGQYGRYVELGGRITYCPPNIDSVQRYFINIMDTGIQLYKSTCEPAVYFILTEVSRPISPDDWHLTQYIFFGNRIQVWLDGEQWLDYTDESDPIMEGGVLRFTTYDSAEILIDDLLIYEVVAGQ